MAQQLVEFLKDYKDPLTIGLSMASAIIVIGVAWFAYRQRSTEGKRTLRSQLIDSISKLIELEARVIVLDNQIENHPNSQLQDRELRAERNAYNEQRRALAQLAAYIISQRALKHELIADAEYAAVARAFAAANDLEQASTYWEKAINTSRQTTYKIKLTGMYADFLFRFDPQKGRKKYDEAVHLTDGDVRDAANPNNFALWEKVHIYSRWARKEARIEPGMDAEELWKKAQETCRSITDPSLRRQGEKNVLPLALEEIRAGRAQSPISHDKK